MKEKKYNPFTIADARKMARAGEKLECKGSVKTEGFDQTIVFMMTLMQILCNSACKYKKFRMELNYDAESLNVNYCIYTPNSECKSGPDYILS